jgi:hypothetical protein
MAPTLVYFLECAKTILADFENILVHPHLKKKNPSHKRSWFFARIEEESAFLFGLDLLKFSTKHRAFDRHLSLGTD